MPSEAGAGEGDGLAGDLIKMLHQGASADEFAARLARAEALAAADTGSADGVELVRMAMAVRNRLDLWEQRERGMLTVIDSARDLSSRLDLRELLRAIVSRARNMLGSQVAWLSTYDPELAAFHVLATDGALSQRTGDMVADRGFGIVSVVLATRLPFSTPDYLHDTRFPHDARLDATFRDEGIAAVVGVPMLWEDEVIGLLFVADRYHRTHGAQNVSILSTLATHAAVAIKNARAFEQARGAAQAAEAARCELERHARRVQAAAEAHEQLTSLLARGAPLATVCESVAALMKGSLLVLDEAAQVIARGSAPGYAAGGAECYAPNEAGSSALAAAIRRSRQLGRSVAAFEADGETCRVSAVIGGDDVLGSVLLFCRSALDETLVRTFERSTSIIGIVLLSRERMEATRVRDLSTLLRALVSPRQDDLPLMCERAARFGLDLALPSSLMLVDIDQPQAAYAARRLRSAHVLPNAICDEIDGVLAILCPTPAAEDVRRSAANWIRSDFGEEFRGILSRPLSGAAEIPGVYATLRRALSVLERIGIQGHIVGQNEMALYSTLFESHDQVSLAAFLHSTIGALTAYDDKRGTDLAATLLVYFDSNQNAKLAAQRLGIHVNTMRQRLGTIEDRVGYWGHATRALELHIALRLWSLSGPARRTPPLA